MVDDQTGGKRKPSAYIKFATKFMKEHPKKGSQKQTDVLKAAGAAWRALSDAEKKKYA